MEITAKIIAHSKSSVNGKEIVTFELQYPRFILAELNTHRLFSRNSASSRAIPVAKMIEQVRLTPAMPVHWGKNQPGMQAKEESNELVNVSTAVGNALVPVQGAWGMAANKAADFAEAMSNAGYHKQIVNRILEPFQWMKTVLTATEFDNFFWLRKHPDAQPEIKLLAELMWEALQVSEPVTLEPGDWHTPYFGDGYWLKDCGIPLEDALAISSSCCAQTSYRKLDDSLEKAKDVFARLVESKPVHASPFEHQASAMTYATTFDQAFGRMQKEDWEITQKDVEWQDGITHCDREGNLWSGNFQGWVQHRQLIPENACWNFVEE